MRHSKAVGRSPSWALLLAGLASAALGCAKLAGLSGDGYYLRNEDAGTAGSGGSAGSAGSSGSGGSLAAGGDSAVAGAGLETGGGAGQGHSSELYTTVEASIMAGGIERTFLVARPRSVPDDAELPLVFSFHGHNDTSESTADRIRAELPLEDEAAGAATFVYPRAPGVDWSFTTDAQRANEAEVVTAMIEAVDGMFGVDRARVFLVGWDGGAFLVNSVACRLPAGLLRGVAIHSGSLYSVDTPDGGKDFDEEPSGRTTCHLPSALLIWGTSDVGVSYAMQGTLTRNYYVGTLQCATTTMPWPSAPPCVSYDACSAELVWCSIDGLGHSLWPEASAAIWRFIDNQR